MTLEEKYKINIIQKPISKNFTRGRYHNGKPCTADQIILHTCEGNDPYPWFTHPDNNNSSAHFSIDFQGNIYQYVDTYDTAWHTGGLANNIGIGIEHWDNLNPADSVRSTAMYESSARLVAYLCEKHNKPIQFVPNADAPGVVLHRTYNHNRTCPGGLDHLRIVNRAKEIASEVNTPMTDEYYRVYNQNHEQTGAFLEQDNAFDMWYIERGKVTYKKEYITEKFIEMATNLEKELEAAKKEIEKLQITLKDTESSLNATRLTKELAEEQIRTFHKSLWGQIYLLFKKNG